MINLPVLAKWFLARFRISERAVCEMQVRVVPAVQEGHQALGAFTAP